MSNTPIQTNLFDPLVEFIKGCKAHPAKGIFRITFVFPGNVELDFKVIGDIMKNIEYMGVDQVFPSPGSFQQISGDIPYEIGQYLMDKMLNKKTRIYPVFGFNPNPKSDWVQEFTDGKPLPDTLKGITNDATQTRPRRISKPSNKETKGQEESSGTA